jgi:hypothetical protein
MVQFGPCATREHLYGEWPIVIPIVKKLSLFWLLLLEFCDGYFGKLCTCYYAGHEIACSGAKYSRNTCSTFGIVSQDLVI